jgi:hypothetical protein
VILVGQAEKPVAVFAIVGSVVRLPTGNRILKVRLPTGNRILKVRLPTGNRILKVRLPTRIGIRVELPSGSRRLEHLYL